ncbi:MAG: bifunctional precorrin-2 dehydrogenase/sirohydrochlorin ferrochelatase [bacterium]|nr:bifunctional precorrin-2 dehydrogenase/sirohydrochlorin ferrochelatase [bacterium]
MKYFPFFMDVSKMQCLIIGGGEVACHKLKAMLAYEMALTVIGTAICEEIKELVIEHKEKVTLKEQPFLITDLLEADVVFAATSDQFLNHLVAEECKRLHLFVNVVDEQEECNFIMPAIIHTEELQIAISSEGKSPAAVSYLKQEIRLSIPKGFDRLVRQLGECREYVMKMVPQQKRRKRIFDWLLVLGLQNGCSISNELIKEVVAQMQEKE